MLTKVERKDIPDPGGRERSEMRVFALATLREFVETTQVGDVREVTGFPIVNEDEVKNATRLVNAMSTERRNVKCDDDIDWFRRGGRVFMERKEPFVPKYVRQD